MDGGDGQRFLQRSVVQVGHAPLRVKLVQDPGELWRAVGIASPAQRGYKPFTFRVGEDQAACPERLVIGMGNDHCCIAPGWP